MILSFPLRSFSQGDGCSNLPVAQYVMSYNKNPSYQRRIVTSNFIKVYFHVYADDNGNGGVTAQQRDDMIDLLNSSFSGNLSFVYNDCQTQFIDDSGIFFAIANVDFCDPFDRNAEHADGVDIHIRGDASPAGNAAGRVDEIGGTQMWLGGTRIDGTPVRASSTLPHEMGHIFGLFHTHRGTCIDGGNIDACSNMMTDAGDPNDGDFVADTPTDGRSGQEQNNCDPAGVNNAFAGCDPNDNIADNPVNNIMSFYRHTCRTDFTPGQYTRMQDLISMDPAFCTDDEVIDGNIYRLPLLVDSPSSSSLSVSWEDTEDYDLYDVYYRLCGSNGSWAILSGINEALSDAFIIQSLQPGFSYDVRVYPSGTTCELYEEATILVGGVDALCNPCSETFDEVVVSTDQVWSQPEFRGEISIFSGATLTISSDVTFGEGSSIYVGPNSKLIISGSSLSACPGKRWEGITLYSDFAGNEAEVILKDGHINDARVGVKAVFEQNFQFWPGGPSYSFLFGGGIVTTQGVSSFNNCKIGIEYGPYDLFGYVFFDQKSDIQGCSFSGCDVAIELDINYGVEIHGCSFTGNGIDIEAFSSAFEITGSNLDGGIGIVSGSTPWAAPQIVGNDFIDCYIWYEHGLTAMDGSLRNNRFFCGGAGDGVLINGSTPIKIEENDFYGCGTDNPLGNGSYSEAALYYDNTGIWGGSGPFGNGNLIRSNLFDYSGEDATNAVEENDFEYLTNCFFGSDRFDIGLIDASISLEHGAEELSAGNCFTKPYSSYRPIGGNVSSGSEFLYYSKDAFAEVDNCKNPNKRPFIYETRDAFVEVDPSCGTSNYPTSIANRYLYCTFEYDGTLDDFNRMIAEIRAELVALENDDSIPPHVKKWLKRRLERCLDSHMRRSVIKWIKQDSIEVAVEVLKAQESFRYKAIALGLLTHAGDYSAASEYLTSINAERSSEADFVYAQSIWLDYLMDRGNYELSDADSTYLRQVAMKDNLHSYAARGIYYRLTGERLRLPIRYVNDDPSGAPLVNTSDINTDEALSVYPNPSDGTVARLSTPVKGDLSVVIVDLSGMEVHKDQMLMGDDRIELDDLPAGCYVLRLVTPDGQATYTTKLLVTP